MKRLLAALGCALLIGAAPAPAAGIRSSGTLVVQANISGEPLTVGGTIALYRRASLYRLDVLSLGFPGAGAAAGAAAGALLGSGTATIIYDGATGALTAYSSANRTYYSEGAKVASPGASAAAAAPPGKIGGPDPLEALASVTRQLHDVQRAAILFTGHATTNGHPVSDIDVQLKRQVPGKPLEDYHAQLSLADDLDGFPVRVLFSSVPASTGAFGGNLRLDLTTAQRDMPDDSVFAVPSGFTRVTSLGDVLRRPR